jgi:hypothetical protein
VCVATAFAPSPRPIGAPESGVKTLEGKVIRIHTPGFLLSSNEPGLQVASVGTPILHWRGLLRYPLRRPPLFDLFVVLPPSACVLPSILGVWRSSESLYVHLYIGNACWYGLHVAPWIS